MQLILLEMVKPRFVVCGIEVMNGAVVLGDEPAGAGTGFVEGFVGFFFV